MKIALITLDPEERFAFSHPSGVIGQGLLQLGHEVFVHKNKSALERIFASNGVFPPQLTGLGYFEDFSEISGFDLLLFDATFNRQFDLDALLPFKEKIVVIDNGDTAQLRNCPDELIFFCSHLNKKTIKKLSERRLPLPFGISQELIEFTDLLLGTGPVQKSGIASNFGPSLAQSVRAAMTLQLLPKLKRIFPINEGRSGHEAYLRLLAASKACLSYGGEFIQNIYANPFLRASIDAGKFSEDLKFEYFEGDAAIGRWDSWRFYESLACGTLPIQLQFDKYGFQLPVEPTKWEHYLPVDLEELGPFTDFLGYINQTNPGFFSESGVSARSWAIDNFGPLGMANYLLDPVFCH
jgi:hypothetical protein